MRVKMSLVVNLRASEVLGMQSIGSNNSLLVHDVPDLDRHTQF